MGRGVFREVKESALRPLVIIVVLQKFFFGQINIMSACVSKLFVAVTKIHENNNLEEEEFIWGSFLGLSPWSLDSIGLGPR